MPSLTAVQARERAQLLDVTAYDLDLDLDRGAEVFSSTSRIAFSCRRPGEGSVLDVRARTLESVSLNGQALDPATCVDGRLSLPQLAADNVVEVVATMAYRHDGEGLHRASDPADGRDYVYGMSFLDAAPTVFACFDQPDLKAPCTLSVTAPADWVVVANGVCDGPEPERKGARRWRFATTPPLATYVVTICAGPYVSVESEHRGIPLRWFARASLAEPLRAQGPELLRVTGQGLDYYEELFGIPYAFGGYDQIFVPEFNPGAMENPGCVTYAESMLFRGAATTAQRRVRANTILHEMAHMWFGDLVTMRWWDDLWLNESFAEYMAHRSLEAASDFSGAWVDFGLSRKLWGYAAERRPSTHPVAANPAPDAASALLNFDGISYTKGAAVIRQLIAYVGDEAFVAGIRDHLSRHAHGNADLADFLGAIEGAAGVDLGPWAAAWLRTAGRDVLSVQTQVESGADGEVLRDVAIVRTPPASTLEAVARPHALDIAGYVDGRESWREQVTLTADSTPLPVLTGRPVPELLLANAGDLTWAGVDLDEATWAALPTRLGLLSDPQARVVAWVALIDAVIEGRRPIGLLLDAVEAALPGETDSAVVGVLARTLLDTVVPGYAPDPAAARARLAAAAQLLLTRAEASTDDGSLRLAALRMLVAACDDQERLRRLLAGEDEATGLADDVDFGWLCLSALARAGFADETEIEARRRLDPSLDGALHALAARASIPTAAAKAWAWLELVARPQESARSTHERLQLAVGFWRGAGDEIRDVLRPYVERYLAQVPPLEGPLGDAAFGKIAAAAFPAVMVEPATADLVAARLADASLGVASRRALGDGLADLRLALHARATFG